MTSRITTFIQAGLSVLLFSIAMLVSSWAIAQEVPVGAAETSGTQAVVRDQLNAFKSGDVERAYSHAAPNVKNIFPTLDRFTSMVQKGYGAIWQSDSYVFGRNTIINGEIYQEVLITDPKGGQWQAVYTLKQQEDGSWKITGVQMNPYKGATT